MKVYIGTKIIQAEPMEETVIRIKGENSQMNPQVEGFKEFKETERSDAVRPGYRVIYPGGYVSWSPKEVFEAAYREVSIEERQLLRSDEEQTEGGGE